MPLHSNDNWLLYHLHMPNMIRYSGVSQRHENRKMFKCISALILSLLLSALLTDLMVLLDLELDALSVNPLELHRSILANNIMR